MGDSYDWLIHDHSEFESALHNLAEELEREHWAQVREQFTQMADGVLAHMAMEEEVIYPAYADTPGLPQRPLSALSAEHKNILSELRALSSEIEGGNVRSAQTALDDLERALVNHHEREETFFLPMAGHLLQPQREEIEARLATFDAAAASRQWLL